MNCQDFAQIVSDLARERLMDAGVRADAQAHAGTCTRCELRLVDEQALNKGLRALAARVESASAPAHLAAALLAAFREQQHAAGSAPQAVSSNRQMAVVNSPSAVRQLPSGWRWWAAAAAVLLLFALAASQLMNATTTANKVIVNAIPQQPQATPAPINQEEAPPRMIRHDEIAPQPVNNPKSQVVVNRSGSTHRRLIPRPAPVSKDSGNDSPQTAAETEVLSDFIPLGSDLNQAPIESGHLVRVRMPRSALTAFGLPMNFDRANESIKADVLIGDDGVARAIRFANYVPGRVPR